MSLEECFRALLNVSEDEEPKTPVLSSFDLDGVAKYIKDKEVERVVVMLGAGASVAAGIPDFRTPGTGLYDNLEKYNLPAPEAIFTLNYLQQKPEAFFTLAKELWPGNYRTTTAHLFLRLLHEKGLLLRCYTQNIDGLEAEAYPEETYPADKYIAAHGNFDTSGCVGCGKEYPTSYVKEAVMADRVPRCDIEGCDQVVKPSIVFFGESLPERFGRCAIKDLRKTELLLIIGTSLAVEPFASLCRSVPEDVPRVLINRDLVGLSHGLVFSGKKQYRDLHVDGDLQDGCLRLAEALGWKDELLQMKAVYDEQFDKEQAEREKQDLEKEP